MAARKYDAIVIGAGSMGSSACFHLAAQGYRVLVLEQFDTVPHDKGSHAGQSRIIRKAYFEHPDYVPLLNRAYENWKQLEKITGEQVYFKTGLLYCSPLQHEVMEGVKSAASKFNIELKTIADPSAFPAFSLAEGDAMLLEPDAGFLLPEKCIELYLREGLKRGAELKTGERVLEWEREGAYLKVLTNKSVYYTSKLIITAGAWAENVIRQLSVPFKVTRQVIVWVEPENPVDYVPERFPCWLIAGENINGVWYGFPYLTGDRFPGPAGLKFALHYPGDETDPDHVKREVTDAEILSITNEAKKYFKPAGAKRVAVKTCLYANTMDEHFIIDHLPGYDGDVTIACGFSGHGFKFASVVGEILADLSVKGKTNLPAGFLGLKRFQQKA
ncbi:MAG: N-methyl-L-tryptophan oxidase [Bacteroidetes bacterium]|nr:N-methyl-L-tryptophan oxidase [Bacteroidota bacterium]